MSLLKLRPVSSVLNQWKRFYTWFRKNLDHGLENGITESAAAISFYLIFSLFPFLLLVISIGSFWLESYEVQRMILAMATRYLPENSLTYLTETIIKVIAGREAVGLIGIIFLIWPSSMAFSMLAHAINRAWPTSSQRGILFSRIVGILVVAGSVVLLAIYFLLQTSLNFLGGTGWYLFNSLFVHLLSRVLLLVFPIFVLILLYRYVPKRTVTWREALTGSSVAIVLLQTVTFIFGLLVESGLITYSLVYGSLGTFIAFMTWLYLLNFSVLLGAYMCKINYEK